TFVPSSRNGIVFERDTSIMAMTFKSVSDSPSTRRTILAKLDASGLLCSSSPRKKAAKMRRLRSYSPSFAASKNLYAIGINGTNCPCERSCTLPFRSSSKRSFSAFRWYTSLRDSRSQAERHEGRNEKLAGDNCLTLAVEYRPSARYLQQSP